MKTGFVFTAGLFFLTVLFSCAKKTLPAECNMPAEPGMCMAAIPRFYYNPNTHQCEQFVWGGCGDFPFETMAECETACE